MGNPIEFEVGKIELPEPPTVTFPDECLITTTEGKIQWLVSALEDTCKEFIRASEECERNLLFIKSRIEQLKQDKKGL